MTDQSNGWEAVSGQFIRRRREVHIGAETILAWAATLPPEASILDLGCGSGTPVATTLTQLRFRVHGIDASPSMVAEFRRQLPQVPVACEAAETSRFFDTTFDAVVAIGLLFLLTEEVQKAIIVKVGAALKSGGRFLFTSPSQRCEWIDVMTGRTSISLGAREYQKQLEATGLKLRTTYIDEGENHYIDAQKAVRTDAA
jgi:cyclopropane fatty-acyl-phospholipid synthase-like methyltransferase